MKIRNGFVSNSSSSSFIMLTKSCNCPTCKVNPVDMLFCLIEQNHNETELIFKRSLVDHIEKLDEQINAKQEEIKEHQRFPEDEEIKTYWAAQHGTTHGRVINWIKSDIETLEENKQMIIDNQDEYEFVCNISIDYNDLIIYPFINALKDNKYIKEIKDDEE